MSGQQQADVDNIRGLFNSTLNSPLFAFKLHGDLEGTVVGPRKIFETWLNCEAFHQDPEDSSIYEELLKFGPRFVFAVHAIALRLAGRILDLDDIIADALEEPRVSRIEPT